MTRSAQPKGPRSFATSPRTGGLRGTFLKRRRARAARIGGVTACNGWGIQNVNGKERTSHPEKSSRKPVSACLEAIESMNPSTPCHFLFSS